MNKPPASLNAFCINVIVKASWTALSFQRCVHEMVCISQIEWNVQFRERHRNGGRDNAFCLCSFRRPHRVCHCGGLLQSRTERSAFGQVWCSESIKWDITQQKLAWCLINYSFFYFTGGTITLETGQASRSMACCHGSMNIRSLFYHFHSETSLCEVNR